MWTVHLRLTAVTGTKRSAVWPADERVNRRILQEGTKYAVRVYTQMCDNFRETVRRVDINGKRASQGEVCGGGGSDHRADRETVSVCVSDFMIAVQCFTSPHPCSQRGVQDEPSPVTLCSTVQYSLGRKTPTNGHAKHFHMLINCTAGKCRKGTGRFMTSLSHKQEMFRLVFI